MEGTSQTGKCVVRAEDFRAQTNCHARNGQSSAQNWIHMLEKYVISYGGSSAGVVFPSELIRRGKISSARRKQTFQSGTQEKFSLSKGVLQKVIEKH